MSKEFCIEKEVENEIIIKKSRFICHMKPVFSSAEAIEYIVSIKEKHKSANHNCSAYITSGIEHASDDGEPSQTAGVPMLSVLQKQNMNNIVVVVTRYFGGTKLGSGGLIRAYSSAVTEALKEVVIDELVAGVSVNIIMSHSDISKVKSILSKYRFNSISEYFKDNIIIDISMNRDDFEALKEEVLEFNYLIKFEEEKSIKVIKL